MVISRLSLAVPVGRRLFRQSMHHWLGLDIGSGTRLRVCRICTRPVQLLLRMHRHGVPSQGGTEQRSAHTFAEMVQAFVEEEQTTTSAKARLQSITAAAHILRPKLSIPAVVGLCQLCTETSLARYASAPDRASIPGGHAPPCRICDRSYVEIAAACILLARRHEREADGGALPPADRGRIPVPPIISRG